MEEMKACRVGSFRGAGAGAYQEAFESTEDSFCRHDFRQPSGSYTSAMLGKSLAEENGAHVHVFDQRSRRRRGAPHPKILSISARAAKIGNHHAYRAHYRQHEDVLHSG
jgi:hypothetical protein